MQVGESSLRREHRRLTMDMYAEITKAVAAVAQERGFNLVLYRDAALVDTDETLELLAQIRGRKCSTATTGWTSPPRCSPGSTPPIEAGRTGAVALGARVLAQADATIYDMSDWPMGDRTATVQSIAEWVGGRVEGDGSVQIGGIASWEAAGAGELTFATDAKHAAHLGQSRASAAIVAAEVAVSVAMPLIRVADVQAAVATVLGHWLPPPDHPPAGVHPSAVIAKDAEVDPAAAIGPVVTIGSQARIGPGSVLRAGVSVGREARRGSGLSAGGGRGDRRPVHPGRPRHHRPQQRHRLGRFRLLLRRRPAPQDSAHRPRGDRRRRGDRRLHLRGPGQVRRDADRRRDEDRQSRADRPQRADRPALHPGRPGRASRAARGWGTAWCWAGTSACATTSPWATA